MAKVTIVKPKDLSSKSLRAADYIAPKPKKVQLRITIDVEYESGDLKRIAEEVQENVRVCIANHDLLQNKAGDAVVKNWSTRAAKSIEP